MFVRSRGVRLNTIVSVLFVLAAGACDTGGLGCCSTLPLPGGALPADQTVEGGAQVRITPAGMTKVNQLIAAVLRDSFGGGFCVNEGSVGGSCLGTDYCDTNQGGSCGGSRGCHVPISVDFINVSVVDNDTMRVQVQIDASAQVHLDAHIACIPASCTLGVTATNLLVDANIDLGIRPSDGELTINLAGINNTDFQGTNFSGCSIVSDLGNLILDILDSFIGDFILDLLTPTLNNLIQGFLPDPLGIEGLIDLGTMLEGVSPGTEALMEGRFVPGGYVSLNGGGMTLGLITGINADEDPSTRAPDTDSEPALCVPPFGPPNFAAPPASLPITSRGTFTLAAAGAFSGNPDPGKDMALGVSETTLDQLGHHLVTSGAMCLGVGSAYADVLNVGTIGILVPSLAELGSESGDDPLLLVTRPQRPVDFVVGDGVSTPNLTIRISNLEVDFYAFLYERYTRVFTLSLTLDAGLNLMVDNAANPVTITPMLTGLSAQDIQVRVLNSEFVRETPQELEMVLPTVFDLALPMLADGIGPIDVPDFAGFSLRDISIAKVTTSQDDFLAINAGLAASALMKAQAVHHPALADVIADIDRPFTAGQPARANGTARLAKVETPAPAAVRGALIGTGGAMPAVTIDVDRTDSQGRPLEWTWRLNGGLWRPFTTAAPLVISDRAFAWQGKYTIGLKSRVVGDDRTMAADVIDIPVIIDSVGPKVIEAEVAWDDDALVAPAVDIVSHRNLQWAFAKPGADEPATSWQSNERLPRIIAESLLVDRELQVFVKDEAGNVTMALITPFHGQAGEGGCNCDATGGPGAGGVLMLLVVGGLLFVRRRHVVALAHSRRARSVGYWLTASFLTAFVPGCDCGDHTRSCETVEDCDGFCETGIPFCLENMCQCLDDIPPGKIGPYSDVAGGPLGEAWVSAYAQTHGDLVVARVETGGRVPDTSWEWVDGVPDGPVEIPGAMIRGGILLAGPDVGMYTSIGVQPDGTPRVTYYDRDRGTLKFAAKVGGVWQKHDIDVGTGSIDADGGRLAGMYSSISLRTDDGRPGVAYTVHVNQGGTVHAEVRWASSQVAVPQSAADWTFWTIDTADLPVEDPASPDVFPLPNGLGLFVDATRGPDQAPVVVYYDRAAGDLKMSKFDTTGGTFNAPVVLDGAGSDAGWSPTVGVDASGVVHVAYVGATYDDLLYIKSDAPTTREVIDNGYRIVGTTDDGLPKPVFHFVGDDASMVMTPSGPTVAYQDATTHELLLAQRNATSGQWTHITIAGAEDPFIGAYGFFASAGKTETEVLMSTWVLDQPNTAQWVEVFRRDFLVE